MEANNLWNRFTRDCYEIFEKFELKDYDISLNIDKKGYFIEYCENVPDELIDVFEDYIKSIRKKEDKIENKNINERLKKWLISNGKI